MADLTSIVNQLITERDRLNAAIAALQGVSNKASRKGRRSKRTMSAAARARIAAAQRKRWAKVRAKKRA